MGYGNSEYGRYYLQYINCLLTHSLTTEDGTCGGTANGAKCVFPFKYKGNIYNSCTKTDHDQLWCATESVYEINRKWGNCDCGQCFDGFWVFGVSMINGLNGNSYFKPLALPPQVVTSFFSL